MEKYHFENIDSTSSYLKRNYKKLDNITFVSADYQEEGHGRYGRKWYSEDKKNLLFSAKNGNIHICVIVKGGVFRAEH